VTTVSLAKDRTGDDLDPRRHAFRADLADLALQGRVAAERFEAGSPGQMTRAAVPLRKAPEMARGLETEVLYGERVTVFDEVDGWAWVQLERDRYVGYIPADAITRTLTPASHRVQALGTFLYATPDIKTPPLMHLALNSLLSIRSSNERFAELAQGGFVIARHISPVDRMARDYAEIAERFVGTPYLWGGRTRIGIDCSGLVQTALEATGQSAPRDSDMQQAELGHEIEFDATLDSIERGDLVFWRGHTGIMLDSVLMVHANAHHMAVTVEPLPEAAARIAKTGGPITAIKRLGGTES
jgi:cell wall-associated NlpC family hydrolase